MRALTGLAGIVQQPGHEARSSGCAEPEAGRRELGSLARHPKVFSPSTFPWCGSAEMSGLLEEIFLRSSNTWNSSVSCANRSSRRCATRCSSSSPWRPPSSSSTFRDPGLRQGVQGLRRRIAADDPCLIGFPTSWSPTGRPAPRRDGGAIAAFSAGLATAAGCYRWEAIDTALPHRRQRSSSGGACPFRPQLRPRHPQRSASHAGPWPTGADRG